MWLPSATVASVPVVELALVGCFRAGKPGLFQGYLSYSFPCGQSGRGQILGEDSVCSLPAWWAFSQIT